MEEPVGSERRARVMAPGWEMAHQVDRRVHLEPVLIVSVDGLRAGEGRPLMRAFVSER